MIKSFQQDIYNTKENTNIELRDYQNKLISNVRKSIAEGNRRVIMQLHVGGGKTLVASEIIRMAIEKRNKVLFLAPRRQLIYQTVETLTDYGISSGMIMAGEQRFTQPLVQVASFDTITSRVGSGRMEMPEASLCIVDEAHMCVSPARINVLSQYKTVLALTATPALANGKGMGFFYQDIVQSLTMTEMVEQKYLVPMRYFVGDSPDLSKVILNKDGDFTEKQLGEINDEPKLIGSIYENWKRIAGNRCTLIFAVNRKHAKHLAEEFLSHGVRTEYLDGDTSPEERETIKNRVMSGITQVVINIGVMIAGVNWPRIDCVVIARQTRNIASWIQMIGRGSRLYPGKSDCIVIYHGSNFDELGQIDSDIEWSLDGKETIRERKERKQKEEKQKKDIHCGECGSVFSGRKTCPACGYEIIKEGEPIPVFEAELQEVTVTKKPTPVDKSQFYAELLGYAMKHKKSTSFALAIFRDKFKEWPYNKNSIKPVEPSKETIGYIKHARIKWVKGKGRKAA